MIVMVNSKVEIADRPILRGKHLVLRPPQESDKQDRLAYGRNPEFRKMVGGDPLTWSPLTEIEVEEWYIQLCQEPLEWVIETEGRCIGITRLHSLDPANRRARYAVGIFDPAYWGRGLGTEVTRLVLQYAFEVLHLHRVDLRVLAFNHRAVACYEKCGFVREGIEREGAYIGDEWQSDVMMSILEQEYRSQLGPA
jgi:RimJ/RimL family protein N-acetyltransferase